MSDQSNERADSMPTEAEEEAAERAAEDAPDVEETYREMTEKGANVKGEGELPPD